MRIPCGNYELEYEIYPVEQGGNWHEYKVTLYQNGHYIDSWDSLHETYNGMVSQRLTQEGCMNAISDIAKDIESGNASDWFTVYQEII